MDFVDKVNQDINNTLKEGDRFKVGVLKMLKNSLDNAIKANPKITEEEMHKIVKKEIKLRNDAKDIYLKNGEPERASQEEKEIKILKLYAPTEMSHEEIEVVISEVLKNNSSGNFGEIMKEAMKLLAGKADGKDVANIIKTKLEGTK